MMPLSVEEVANIRRIAEGSPVGTIIRNDVCLALCDTIIALRVPSVASPGARATPPGVDPGAEPVEADLSEPFTDEQAAALGFSLQGKFAELSGVRAASPSVASPLERATGAPTLDNLLSVLRLGARSEGAYFTPDQCRAFAADLAAVLPSPEPT